MHNASIFEPYQPVGMASDVGFMGDQDQRDTLVDIEPAKQRHNFFTKVAQDAPLLAAGRNE